jgi:hypothetical protein
MSRSGNRRWRLTADLAPTVMLVGFGVLALGPTLWSRGYVLVGDMTFVPDQPWKSAWLGLDGSVPRAVPADALVSVLSHAMPGDLLQKAILLGILVLAGLGMIRMARIVPGGVAWPARLGGAVLYLWNPYVFERLAIGHWGLLVGYAALPWVLAAALDVRRNVGSGAGRDIARLLLLLAIAAAGSPTGGLVAGLVAVVVTVDRHEVRRTLSVIGAVVLVNLPWLAPGVLNDAGVSDGSGVAAFAARADTSLGAVGSLLTFGGMWKASAAPTERDAGLLVATALVLVIVSLAALVVVGRRPAVREALAADRLVLLAVLGFVLAALPTTGAGERLVTDLVDAATGAGLWRDSQKWLMPFVLVTCLGFALLLDGLGQQLRRRGLPAASSVVVLALAPVVLLPSLAWGLSGRFDPVDFPAEWQTVRTILSEQPAGDRQVAVLPWSAYQRLPWNDHRAALDPSIRFFPGQVVASEDLTISDELTVSGDDRAAARIGRAIAEEEPLGPVLAEVGVRYLLIEKTAPTAVDVAVPTGTTLHDGDELQLVDLGNGSPVRQSSHRSLILAADALTLLALAGGAVAAIRRKPDGGIGYHARGSSIDGSDDAADYR